MTYIYFYARATNAENKKKLHRITTAAYITAHRRRAPSVGASGRTAIYFATFAAKTTNLTDIKQNKVVWPITTLSSKTSYYFKLKNYAF